MNSQRGSDVLYRRSASHMVRPSPLIGGESGLTGSARLAAALEGASHSSVRDWEEGGGGNTYWCEHTTLRGPDTPLLWPIPIRVTIRQTLSSDPHHLCLDASHTMHAVLSFVHECF